MEFYRKPVYCVGLILTVLVFVNVIKASDVLTPKIPVFMGTVDGKSYFRDDTIYTTWFGAKEICNASGLHLATITSASQLAFFTGISGDFPLAAYWIGGREAREETRMFSWDETGNDISTIIPNYTDALGSTYFACLMYSSRNENSRIWSYQCSRNGSDVGTFCET